MKNKKNAIETLAEKPNFVLSYDRFGSETWSTRQKLTQFPVPEGKRTVWQNVQGELSSDQLMIEILKMNPGTELQLMDSEGMLPGFAMFLNGQNVLSLKLPEGVSIIDGCIWARWDRHSIKLCLIELKW